MRSARTNLIAAGAAAVLASAGYTVVSSPAEMPGVNEARSAGKNLPPASTAPDQPTSPDDRRQWLRSRYTSPRYRGLRKPRSSHKQNRRRALAAR